MIIIAGASLSEQHTDLFTKLPARCRVKVALRHTYVSCACAMPHPLWT